ncbi:MAG: site-specific integrase [Colwellia sp.]|nr:site-specific integrase [Colwellia sp.]
MDSKLTGITANKSSIQIAFTYNGMRCRETLKVKPTKSSLKEMVRKRDVILYEIGMGKFDYLEHFPNSKKAQELAGSQACNITVTQMVDDWFKRNQNQWEYSNKRGYISKIKHHIAPNFGHITINKFKPSMFKDWGATVTNQKTNEPLSGKTKNEVRSILRSSFQELYIDEVIDGNPIDRVKRFKHVKKEPEPFNADEREAILAQMTGQVRNLYEFAFWTGLRTSELLALRKCDIDLEREVIFVRKALVHGREKGTKTKAGERTHQLHEVALKALIKQLAVSPDNQERVFTNPKTMQPWRDDRAIYNSCWKPALKLSQVKFRKQYNTRHTYASTMLTLNEPIAWVARQLGHSDIAMTLTTYARWIPESD